MPKAQLLDQLAWALIENTEWSVAEQLACRILGIEPTGENDDGEEPDPSLIAAAEAGPDQAGRVALALSLAIAEARVADRWRPEWDRVTRHFVFLEAHGYTVSVVEGRSWRSLSVAVRSTRQTRRSLRSSRRSRGRTPTGPRTRWRKHRRAERRR